MLRMVAGRAEAARLYAGSVEQEGVMPAKLSNAVRAYQQATAGLPVDGQLSVDTWAALIGGK
jgi:hypothetical protein